MLIDEIILSTDSGSILLGELQQLDDYVKGRGVVSIDWVNANVLFECSLDRLKEFYNQLESLLNGRSEKVYFINDQGNFELTITLDVKTGRVGVSGLIMSNLYDDDQLKFSMQSDWGSIRRFCDSLAYFKDFKI